VTNLDFAMAPWAAAARPKLRRLDMYPQVSKVIRKFIVSETTGGEGELTSMYLDVRGLVTTGRGNLLPNADSANSLGNVPLKWQRIDNGAAASPTDVKAEWTRVGSDDTKRQIPNRNASGVWKGGGNFMAEAIRLGIVTLKLTDASLDALFQEAIAQFDRIVKTPPTGSRDFDKTPGGFPADAQLGLLAVAYGIGHLEAPLRDACNARQWGQIASQGLYKINWSNIRSGKDAAIKTCFENAQVAEDQLAKDPNVDVRIVKFNIAACR
jgi:hypothetical protein